MRTRRIIPALLLAALLLPIQTQPQAVSSPEVSSICGDAAGTRFNLEPTEFPTSRDSFPHPKYQPSVDMLRGRVRRGVDLVVGGATDLRAREVTSAEPLGEADIDFIRRSSGYYVNRRGANCTPEFEGFLPRLQLGQAPLFGAGTVVVAADAARDAVFIADFRAGSFGGPTTVGVGIFRAPAATLLDEVACPPGTHTEAQAAACWPTGQTVLTRSGRVQNLGILDLAVDERPSGTGAGTVYVVAETGGGVELVACTNDLSSCSSPVAVTGFFPTGTSPSLAVRPDGDVTVTMIRFSGEETEDEIVYVACSAASPPTAPVCGDVHPVAGGFQLLRSLDALAAQAFAAPTYPRHAHRAHKNRIETYVVWHQCKGRDTPFLSPAGPRVCPDVDVVFSVSMDDGVTGSWSAPACVSCLSRDQLFPAIRTDPVRNVVNIAYYSAHNDFFGHRLQVFLNQVPRSGPTLVTTRATDPSSTGTIAVDGPSQERPAFISGALLGAPGFPLDLGTTAISLAFPFGQRLFPQSIGVAARAHRIYVHYTFNTVRSTKETLVSFEPSEIAKLKFFTPHNHLSRLDH